MSRCRSLGSRPGRAALKVSGFALLALLANPSAQAADQKPNVVFILADNVGYGDLGPYGGGELRGAPTPRIDQLAREGLRLTQYLVEPGRVPRWCPSRWGGELAAVRARLKNAAASARPIREGRSGRLC